MLKVQDVMTRSVISVRPETPLKDVARLMIDHRISGLPVVDTHGAVVGVVSEADFLMKEQGPEGHARRPLEWLVGPSRASRERAAKLDAVTAGEAMTSPPVTIAPTRTVTQAAMLMTQRHVARLPVVGAGRLTGIVTRADLVRAYVRSDEELARMIREDVILGILWLDPALFEVSVSDGIAAIRGRVERRSTAEMLERTVAMVPGIVGVEPAVTWSMDDERIAPATVDPVFPFSPH